MDFTHIVAKYKERYFDVFQTMGKTNIEEIDGEKYASYKQNHPVLECSSAIENSYASYLTVDNRKMWGYSMFNCLPTFEVEDFIKTMFNDHYRQMVNTMVVGGNHLIWLENGEIKRSIEQLIAWTAFRIPIRIEVKGQDANIIKDNNIEMSVVCANGNIRNGEIPIVVYQTGIQSIIRENLKDDEIIYIKEISDKKYEVFAISIDNELTSRSLGVVPGGIPEILANSTEGCIVDIGTDTRAIYLNEKRAKTTDQGPLANDIVDYVLMGEETGIQIMGICAQDAKMAKIFGLMLKDKILIPSLEESAVIL